MTIANNVKFTSRNFPSDWDIPNDVTGRIIVGGLHEWRAECYYLIDFDRRVIQNCTIEISDYVNAMGDFFSKTISIENLPYASRSYREAAYNFVQPHEGLCLKSGTIVYAMHNASYMRIVDFDQKIVSHFSNSNVFIPEMLSATNSLSRSGDCISYSVTNMEQRASKYNGVDIDLDTSIFDVDVNFSSSKFICELKTREAIHEVKVCPEEQFILLTEFCLSTPGKLPPFNDRVFDCYEAWINYEKSGLFESNIYLVDRGSNKYSSIIANNKTPGHVEFSKVDKNRFYLSSHNLSKGHGRLILHGEGNLTIGRIESEKINLIEVFSDFEFYRVTSHKVFSYKELNFIAVTVYPNKLYLLSDPELKVIRNVTLYPHAPIGKHKLHFCELKPHMPIWLETSDNGRYVVLVSNEYFYLYDLELGSLKSFGGYSFNGQFIGTSHITNLNDFR